MIITMDYWAIPKRRACARHVTLSMSPGWIDTLVGGETPTQDKPLPGTRPGCYPASRGWLPLQPPHRPPPRLGAQKDTGEDHLPQTAPPKQSRGSAGCPPAWGCCCCPLSAPRSAPAPTSVEPPRTAPCLSPGRKRSESPTSVAENSWAPRSVTRDGAQETKEAGGPPKDKNGQDSISPALITFPPWLR